MICEECKSRPLARGFRVVPCNQCGKQCTPNSFYVVNICEDCSNKLGICQYCGKSQIPDEKISKEELNQIVDKLCTVAEEIKISVDDFKAAIDKITNISN